MFGGDPVAPISCFVRVSCAAVRSRWSHQMCAR